MVDPRDNFRGAGLQTPDQQGEMDQWIETWKCLSKDASVHILRKKAAKPSPQGKKKRAEGFGWKGKKRVEQNEGRT